MFCRQCGRKIDSERCPYCGKEYVLEEVKSQEEKERIEQIEKQAQLGAIQQEEAVPIQNTEAGEQHDLDRIEQEIAYLEAYTANNAVSNVQWGDDKKNSYSCFNQIQEEVSIRSRSVAGILQIFLGVFGVGRFYMGYAGIGVAQILVTLVTCGTGGLIWGLIDGIMILSGTCVRDADGKVMKN